jgi:hypothetical protein
MARSVELRGKQGGWVDTGIDVGIGDTIAVTASGIITFAKIGFVTAWPRTPDGTDPHGNGAEEPARNWDSQYGIHPAGDFRKNSLVFRINDWVFQGGSRVRVKSIRRGRLFMTVNDNVTDDNEGAWSLSIDITPDPHGP